MGGLAPGARKDAEKSLALYEVLWTGDAQRPVKGSGWLPGRRTGSASLHLKIGETGWRWVRGVL